MPLHKMNSRENSAYILSTISDRYSNAIGLKTDCLINPTECKAIARLARQNGILYIFLTCLNEKGILPEVMSGYLEKEEKRRKGFIKTIELLQTLSLDLKIENLLIKIPGSIPHIPRDVDIFIHRKDESRFYHVLNAKSDNKANFLPIDTYTSIKYFGPIHISSDMMWRAASNKKIFNAYFRGINDELNLLLTLVHAVFGHRRFTMLDFMHVKSLLSKVDMEVCREYARADGWGEILDPMLQLIDDIEDSIFALKGVAFPVLIDRKFIFMLFNELDQKEFFFENLIYYKFMLMRDKFLRFMERTALFEYLLGRFVIRKCLNQCLCYSTRLIEKIASR